MASRQTGRSGGSGPNEFGLVPQTGNIGLKAVDESSAPLVIADLRAADDSGIAPTAGTGRVESRKVGGI